MCERRFQRRQAKGGPAGCPDLRSKWNVSHHVGMGLSRRTVTEQRGRNAVGWRGLVRVQSNGQKMSVVEQRCLHAAAAVGVVGTWRSASTGGQIRRPVPTSRSGHSRSVMWWSRRGWPGLGGQQHARERKPAAASGRGIGGRGFFVSYSSRSLVGRGRRRRSAGMTRTRRLGRDDSDAARGASGGAAQD